MEFSEHWFAISGWHRARQAAVAVGLTAAVLASVTFAAGALAATASPARPSPAGHASTARASAAAVPVTGFSVNNNNREDVRQFFNQVYAASNGVAEGWTGNIGSCTPGSVSPAYLASVLTRTNYYRAMAGVPDVTFNGTDAGTSSDPNNAEAQAAALMESANNFLQHTPPQAGTNCWTQQAFNGSSNSNLFETGSTSPGATGGPGIDDLVMDGNALGHRRNMLNPLITEMGAGAVPSTPGFSGNLAQLVLTAPNGPPDASSVPWPPAGYVPYEVVYPIWSFSLPNANFSGATVSVTLNGNNNPVTTQINCFDPTTNPNCGLFGEPAISWTLPSIAPTGSTWPKPAEDDTYAVTVKNVVVNGGAPQTFTYNVVIFDPAVSDPAHTLSQPTGPATPSVNADPTYSVTGLADPEVTGYQWRTTPLSPANIVDDPATNPSDWTPNVSPAYPTISTAEPTGATAFRLSSQGTVTPLAAPAQQTLTSAETLFPSAGSHLSFGSLFFNLGFSTSPSETASVDVSTDGGSTWTSIFAQSPSGTEQDSAFAPQTVSLSPYAGEQILVRFSLTHTNGEWGSCCGEPNGWYIDNISISGVQTAGTSSFGTAGPSTSFTFENSQTGIFAVDVRPQFTNSSFGSAFLNWSPALVVTSVPLSGSSTSLASSANPSTGGQQVTYTATVSPASATGTVSFTDNSVTICSSVALSAGQATCQQTYSSGSGGTHSIVATYGGGGGVAGSTSPALAEVVNVPVQTVTSLSSSAGTRVPDGQSVTFTATVTPTDSGGTVQFLNGNTQISGCGTVPLTAAGQAICTVTASGAGRQEINALYAGDAGFAASGGGDTLDQFVQGTTSLSAITPSANPTPTGTEVTYSTTLSPTAASVGSAYVTFTDNNQPIASCGQVVADMNTGEATCDLQSPYYTTAGPHSIQAYYTDENSEITYATSYSTILSEWAGSNPAPTSTAMTSSANPATTGQQVIYTATVTGSAGTGTVYFSDAGAEIAGCEAVSLTGGKATCQQTYSNASSHSIVATYSGDASSAGSSSTAVSESVNEVPAPVTQNVAVANLGNGVAQLTFGAKTAGPRAATSTSGTSTVTGYNVYEGTAPGKESTTPVNKSRLLATAKGFTVKGLTTGKHYYFVVRALNARGLGAPSKEASTTAATAPDAPQSLTAHAGRESVALKWTAPSSSGGSAITGYSIYEGTYANGESPKPVTAKPLSGSTRSYTMKGLLDGTKYYLVVRAQNAVAVGAASNEASATPVTVPAAPASLTSTAGKSSAALKWAAPAWNDSGSAVTGYDVYKGTSPGRESTTPVNSKPLSQATRTYTVTGLTNGTKYYFVVKAINAVGTSAASNEISAQPAA